MKSFKKIFRPRLQIVESKTINTVQNCLGDTVEAKESVKYYIIMKKWWSFLMPENGILYARFENANAILDTSHKYGKGTHEMSWHVRYHWHGKLMGTMFYNYEEAKFVMDQMINEPNRFIWT